MNVPARGIITCCLLLAVVPLPSRAADEVSLRFEGCSEQTAVLGFPALAYRSLLPPGFRFTGLGGAGLTALVSVSGSTCASSNGGGPSAELLSFVQVDPPAAYRDPAIPFYGIALGGYSNRPDVVTAFDRLGFGDQIRPGEVTVRVVDHPALRERRGQVVARDADSRIVTNTVVFGPLVALPGSRTRLFAVRDGAVVAIVDGVYTAQSGFIGISTFVQQGDGPAQLPAAVGTAGHATGYDLVITPVPLPVR